MVERYHYSWQRSTALQSSLQQCVLVLLNKQYIFFLILISASICGADDSVGSKDSILDERQVRDINQLQINDLKDIPVSVTFQHGNFSW